MIDAQPIQHEGQQYLLLRDPLALSENNLMVPQAYVPLLALCDGSQTLSGLRAALSLRYGLLVSKQQVQDFIDALDKALLLDNEHAQQARFSAQTAFRQAAFRAPASAGQAYPADPSALAAYLQGFIDALHDQDNPSAISHSSTFGIISPHIDYDRGGPVYAQVWDHTAAAVQQADLAILFGTDHFSEGFPLSLTRQNYATPFGVLPTALKIVDRLAAVIGEQAAFRGELHHRSEHSIELAAVWMHYMRGGKPIETVPILTGALETMLSDSAGQPANLLETVLQELRSAMQGRKVVVIAAGDLAHVGPAFGGSPTNPQRLTALEAADHGLIDAICNGNAVGFYSAIQAVNDANNVCGIAPIYLTLRLLGPLRGQRLGYAICPADQAQTSVVSICGAALQPLASMEEK